MPIPNRSYLTDDIRGELNYYNAYLEKVDSIKRYLAGEEVSAKASKFIQTKSAPAKPPEKKRKVVTEISEATSHLTILKLEGVPENEPRLDDEEAATQRAIEESLKEVHCDGKGKEKSVRSNMKKKWSEDCCQSSKWKAQAKLNLVENDEGHAGPNPVMLRVQTLSSHGCSCWTNLEPGAQAGEPVFLQKSWKRNSLTNQFLEEKSQEDEPEKTNIEAEVQSMVTVPIHQDTSSVPLMTTPVIDLTVSQPVPTATATAKQQRQTTTLHLPPQHNKALTIRS
ncbi:hypothetical protein Tco_1221590 [Tanacetum coccineum]